MKTAVYGDRDMYLFAWVVVAMAGNLSCCCCYGSKAERGEGVVTLQTWL